MIELSDVHEFNFMGMIWWKLGRKSYTGHAVFATQNIRVIVFIQFNLQVVLRGIWKYIHYYGGGIKKQALNKPVIIAGAQPFTMDRSGCRGIRTSSNSSV